MVQSRIIAINVTNASTNSPGFALPKSAWTASGQYASNTNPVVFGNWAVDVNGVWGVNFFGSGYYQDPTGLQELYFNVGTDGIAWLNAHGYNTTFPIVGPGNPAGTGPNNTISVGGQLFYYYTGNVLSLSDQGAILTSGLPFLFAANGYTQPGYYWFVAHNALTATPISSPSQFQTFNNAIGNVVLNAPQGVVP